MVLAILLILALLAGGALWFYRKKKKENAAAEWQRADGEKFGASTFPSTAASSNSRGGDSSDEKQGAFAPRVSLRPVTQFIPDIATSKKRLSQGNLLSSSSKSAGMAAAGAGRNLTGDKSNGSPWERRVGDDGAGTGAGAGTPAGAANPFKDPVNPFGDQAKAPAPSTPEVTVTPPASGQNPNAPSGFAAGGAGAAAAAAVAGAAGAAAVAAVGKKGNGQAKQGPGGPEGAPIAARGPPPSNVHRVQLDFKPSMDDELELRNGQLVRILHEYDDGWVRSRSCSQASNLLIPAC